MNLEPGKARPYLITRSLQPENQETPIHFIPFNKPVTNSLFYRRNHFPYPILTLEAFSLTLSGSVENTLKFSYLDLQMFPSATIRTFIECSGNKRAFFKEKVFGEQWEHGAMSEGTWRGVRLKDLLQYSRVKTQAKEVIFKGRDSGLKKGSNVHFKRSLPLTKALDPNVIVAYEFNGKPLSHKHGYPFRLVVPGWYGMASVKWLTDIVVIEDTFTGPFQTDDYVYYYPDETCEAVTENRVNSTIQQPVDKQILLKGIHEITGIAWTGTGTISKVEISFDQGDNWEICTLLEDSRMYQTVLWNYTAELASGKEYHITVRATDSAGNIQPDEAIWNKKGYGYNGVMKITVKVE
ncbi:sulfite oxidase [Mesobacillus subterraneus]|uniref:Sulfite oxidase n=1 Tax=Mesobacillus subterraneus TaxID=285983 RepID=A0A427TPM5_9BACI|nr:sulfite oxidase [Mesobacillus subterraneus]RSD26217.1 sulfite oxidase [Mesobacillus subterraneus]